MNQIALAVIAFACAALGGSIIRDDYQDGRMRLFFGTVDLLVFRREANPAWFFGAMILNITLVTLVVVGGVAALVMAA